MNKQTNIHPRNLQLDFIRFLAAILVVLNHTAEETYPVYSSEFSQLSTGSQLFGICCFTLGRIGVPLFLLLTGYLLLPRNYDQDRTKVFYRRNLVPMFIVWEIWILIYQIYICYCNQIPFPKKEYLLRALLLKNAGLPHTWYMPVILGIYLFLPLVSAALRQCDNRILLRLLGIIFVYLFVINSSTLFFEAFQVKEIYIPSRKLDLYFSGGIYGFYIILGYCIARYKDRISSFINSYRVVLTIAAALTFALTVYVQFYLRSVNHAYNVWYDFFTLPVCSFCIFCLIFNKNIPAKYSHILAELSLCSFGVYLIHELVLKTVISFLSFHSLELSVMAQCIVISFLSFLIVHLLSRIPIFSHLFLHK